MGNWVGKERAVHPDPVDECVGSKSLMRIKVRMTKRELKELMAQVDMTNGGDNSEKLGGLILKEFLEGRLCARVVAVAADEDSDPKVSKYVKGWYQHVEHQFRRRRAPSSVVIKLLKLQYYRFSSV